MYNTYQAQTQNLENMVCLQLYNYLISELTEKHTKAENAEKLLNIPGSNIDSGECGIFIDVYII